MELDKKDIRALSKEELEPSSSELETKLLEEIKCMSGSGIKVSIPLMK